MAQTPKGAVLWLKQSSRFPEERRMTSAGCCFAAGHPVRLGPVAAGVVRFALPQVGVLLGRAGAREGEHAPVVQEDDPGLVVSLHDVAGVVPGEPVVPGAEDVGALLPVDAHEKGAVRGLEDLAERRGQLDALGVEDPGIAPGPALVRGPPHGERVVGVHARLPETVLVAGHSRCSRGSRCPSR